MDSGAILMDFGSVVGGLWRSFDEIWRRGSDGLRQFGKGAPRFGAVLVDSDFGSSQAISA